MFYLGGVGLAIFLQLLLLSKPGKSTADKILAVWLLFVTFHLLLFYFRRVALYPWTIGMEFPLPLIHGPFLYLYTLSLTNRSRGLLISLLHFLPALIILLTSIPFLLLSGDQKQWVNDHQGAGYETYALIKMWANIFSGVIYVILTHLALQRHRKMIVHEFSSTEKINLKWLQGFIFWIAAIWIMVILRNDDLIFGAVVLFILFIGYFGIRQVGIFQSVRPNDSESIDTTDAENNPDEPRKYQKSGLSTENSEALHQELSRLMASEALFRESELSLTELASRLKTPPNHLSQVINEREGKNFYDYINTLRIEEFKRLAASPNSRRFTLIALAQECGFNSKSSFNRYCKKVTGKSPSEILGQGVGVR